MLNELKSIVDCTSPNVIGQVLKAKINEKLYQWILEETESLGEVRITERIEYLLQGKPEVICELGNRKTFSIKRKEYGFCGNTDKCACFRKHLSDTYVPRDMTVVVEKRKQTWIEKYGVDNPSKNLDVQNKRTNTMKEKNYDTIWDKVSHEKETVGYHKVIERVSEFVSPLFTREEYAGSNRKNVYEWQCNTCNDVVHSHIDYGTVPRCKRCDPKTISKAEIEIANFIRSHGIDIKTNTNEVLGNLEYDIYIPSKNLAIEYNGTYWHSTKHKKSNYHVDKYLRSKESGVHLIQIFEDEWGRSKEVILSRIKNILGLDEKIMARKCVVKEIDSIIYKNFLNLHHLQGATGSKYIYGLFFNDELVAVMGFSNSRYTNEGVELIRYCSKATVVGGAGKLLKYFIDAEKPTKIVSYANRCWSNGNLYKALGFDDVTDKENNVGYWYVKKGIRYHRSSYTKGKLIKMGFDVDKTESEIMDEMGYLKIYDCGNYKFVMDLFNPI